MGQDSKIEWTDHTFNPWSGCTKVSPACEHCYAESNYSVKMRGVEWGPSGNRIVKAESGWKEPVKWDFEASRYTIVDAASPNGRAQYRPRVFCASLADVFEDWRGPMLDAQKNHLYSFEGGFPPWAGSPGSPPPGQLPLAMSDVRGRLFRLIDATNNLIWMLLTKRPENIRAMWLKNGMGKCVGTHPSGFVTRSNVWLGTTVEDRKHGLPRIDILRKVPAVIRFLSIEPLLEDLGIINLEGIHWAIIGGESGPGSRPMHPQWARSLRDQCQDGGVPFFFKQWGDWAPYSEVGTPGFTERDILHDKMAWVSPDGRWSKDVRMPADFSDGTILMSRVGKKLAGRQLDGRELSEVPS